MAKILPTKLPFSSTVFHYAESTQCVQKLHERVKELKYVDILQENKKTRTYDTLRPFYENIYCNTANKIFVNFDHC